MHAYLLTELSDWEKSCFRFKKYHFTAFLISNIQFFKMNGYWNLKVYVTIEILHGILNCRMQVLLGLNFNFQILLFIISTVWFSDRPDFLFIILRGNKFAGEHFCFLNRNVIWETGLFQPKSRKLLKVGLLIFPLHAETSCWAFKKQIMTVYKQLSVV
jgi:hypothetical protein